MHRRLLAGALGSLALLVAPAAAHATTTVSIDADTYEAPVVALDDSDDSSYFDVSYVGGASPAVKVHAVFSTVLAKAGGGCTQNGYYEVICPASTVGAVVVEGNGGIDEIRLNLVDDDEGLPAYVYGGEGSDSIGADGSGPVYIDGGAGSDYLTGSAYDDALYGGDGSDSLTGGAGDDTLDGESGSDRLRGGDGADTFIGGTGDDSLQTSSYDSTTAEYYRPGSDLSLTLDGAANDGEAGENDNVAADIEQISIKGGRVTVAGTEGPDSFSVGADAGSIDGGGGDDDISVTGSPALAVIGGSGNDTLSANGGAVANGGAGNDHISVSTGTANGGDGNDEISADNATANGDGGDDRLNGSDRAETLSGGDGNDVLQGGFGSDVLTGGPGLDEFVGDRTERDIVGTGNDRIFARDGLAEPIDCGVGADTAEVDANDVVAATCEQVDKPQVIVPQPGPPATGPAASNQGLTVAKAPTLAGVIRRGLAVRQVCTAACKVTAELIVDKATAKKLGLGKDRRLGIAKTALKKRGEAKLTVKLSAGVKRKLKKLKTLNVTLRVTVGKKATTQTLTLKA